MVSLYSLAHHEIVSVNDVAFSRGNLTWTRAGVSEKVDCNKILFVLEVPNLKGSDLEYFICHLDEDPEDQANPYRLTVYWSASRPSGDFQQYVVRQLPLYLHHGARNDVDVIVSTNSGVGQAVKVWEKVLEPLWKFVAARFGKEPAPEADSSQANTNEFYRLTVTQSAETVRSFAKSLWTSDDLGARSRTIVLLSGDGGVVDLLNGSDEEPTHAPLPLMALLPLGTGNALFHSMHKSLYSDPGPTPLVCGLRTLFQGRPAHLPVFRASFSPGSRIVTFANSSAASTSKVETPISHLNGAIVASYGFHASVVYESDTPEYRVHGDKRFGMVAQELLEGGHPYRAEVAIRRPGSDEFEAIQRDTHAYVLTTLVSNLERAFTISPASKPLERKLRLVHFGAVGGKRTMEVMMKAYDEGKHVDMAWDDGHKVGYQEVEEVRVVTSEDEARWRMVCIDGTIVEIPRDGSMQVKMLDRGPFNVLADSSLQPEI